LENDEKTIKDDMDDQRLKSVSKTIVDKLHAETKEHEKKDSKPSKHQDSKEADEIKTQFSRIAKQHDEFKDSLLKELRQYPQELLAVLTVVKQKLNSQSAVDQKLMAKVEWIQTTMLEEAIVAQRRQNDGTAFILL